MGKATKKPSDNLKWNIFSSEKIFKWLQLSSSVEFYSFNHTKMVAARLFCTNFNISYFLDENQKNWIKQLWKLKSSQWKPAKFIQKISEMHIMVLEAFKMNVFKYISIKMILDFIWIYKNNWVFSVIVYILCLKTYFFHISHGKLKEYKKNATKQWA